MLFFDISNIFVVNMKTVVNIALSTIFALWIMAIAILSVQNATPVSLRFLTFESIQIPVGLLLAFCVAVGMIGISVAKPLLNISNFQQRISGRFEDEPEFFADEDF